MSILGTSEWCKEACDALNNEQFIAIADKVGRLNNLEKMQYVLTMEDLPMHIVIDFTRKGCESVWVTNKDEDINPTFQIAGNLETWHSALIRRHTAIQLYFEHPRYFYDRQLKLLKVFGEDGTAEEKKRKFYSSVDCWNLLQQLTWAIKDVKTEI